MKFYKASILAIMIAAAALFACSEQPGQDGRAAQETGEKDQPRGYMGDDKKDVDNQQDDMNTQEEMNKVNPPMAPPGQQPVQPQQQDQK
jgi:Ni/Co efflux regulator RcnB